MGSQSSSRLAGDRYQHLYSWFLLLELLPKESPYAYAVLEHEGVGAADDVTLHPQPGASVPARYEQVKWHVDHSSSYDFEALVQIGRDAKTSILQKLHSSYIKLQGQPELEIRLVSNWAAHPNLGEHLDAKGDTLKQSFFEAQTKKSKAARDLLCKSLGLKMPGLAEFCKVIRFRLGFGGLEELERMVDERMASCGLKSGRVARHTVLDRISELIEIGGTGKQIDRDALLLEIDNLGLRAPEPTERPISLHFHGWARTDFGEAPDFVIDWTAHFDRSRRNVGSLALWNGRLLPELAQLSMAIRANPRGRLVHVRMKVPLAAGLALGYALSEAAGFRLAAEQAGIGAPAVWRTDAVPSEAQFLVSSKRGGPGRRMLVALEVSAEVRDDVFSFADGASPGFDSVVTLRPANGAGERSVMSQSDAVALAMSAKRVIRQLKQRLRASEIHLVLCCPATLALFLGHRLNAIGTVHVYERTGGDSYCLAVTLTTG